MKKFNFIVYTLLSALFLITSCKNFDDLEKDPNRPSQLPASIILTGVLNDMYDGAWNDVMRWNQFYASNYNYYSTQEYNWTATNFNYFTLKNINKMESEAIRVGADSVNAYSSLGKFLKAYFFINMTQRVGDVPVKDALQGLNNISPKYDAQKNVYLQSFKWLEESNTELAKLIATGGTLSGDIYLGNNLSKWQKVVNVYTLRALISLSKKENDADLNLKQRFADIINNPSKYPILSGMEDNLQYTYNTSLNKYPRNPDLFGFNATRENMTQTYLNTLTSLSDPRTFVVAEPAEAKLKAGIAPTDFQAFVGASSGEDLADMSTKALNGEYSFQNRKRYYSSYLAEPTIIIGFPEMCFNIAESINRGWISGNAEDWYKQGIQASIAFYGIKNGPNNIYFLKKEGNINKDGDYNLYTINFDFDTYYGQSAVKYAGNDPNGLTQILTQKYLAFFQNSGWEAFYNQRRTGVPAFLVGPGTANSQRIPKRWQYPATERTRNVANWKQALVNQFGVESDDINNEMWLLK